MLKNATKLMFDNTFKLRIAERLERELEAARRPWWRRCSGVVVAEDSLPRRARDASKRYEQIDKELKNETEAYTKRSDEFIKKLDELAEARDTEAIKELVSASEKENRNSMKAIQASFREMYRLSDEIEMISIEAKIEGTKLRFDAVKQQATFSAAAVAGVAAITAGVLPNKLHAVGLLWITYGTLLATIIVSLFLLYLESINIQYVLERGKDLEEDSRPRKIRNILYLSALGLPVAIIVYLVFALLNA